MPVRLFVGNLPYESTEVEIREFFAAVAPPLQVFMPMDRETGRPRGFAFVEYADRAQAEEAISRFNNQPFKGRNISVSEARARESRPPGGPSPGAPPRFSSSAPPPPRGERFARPSGPSFGTPSGNRGGLDSDEQRRRRAKPAGARKSERPRGGPIPIRGGGRVYLDEDDAMEERLPDEFDDVAAGRRPGGREEGE